MTTQKQTKKEILFITSTRIGDAILSTSILNHIMHENPDAEITVACGPLVVELFEAFPNIKRVIPLKKEKFKAHWIKLWRQCKNTKWHHIVDLRGTVVSHLLWARKKNIWTTRKDFQDFHKVEQLSRFMGLETHPAPTLYFPEKFREKWADLPTDAPVLAVGPSANFAGKTWDIQNFIALIKKIRQMPAFENAYIAVFAAPNEIEQTEPLLKEFAQDRLLDYTGKTTPLEAAYLIKQCTAYIGNDSGLMHSAAAVGRPCLGLFGPSNHIHYSPWGAHAAFVRTPEDFQSLLKDHEMTGNKDLMKSLTVEMAESAFRKMIESPKNQSLVVDMMVVRSGLTR